MKLVTSALVVKIAITSLFGSFISINSLSYIPYFCFKLNEIVAEKIITITLMCKAVTKRLIHEQNNVTKALFLHYIVN